MIGRTTRPMNSAFRDHPDPSTSSSRPSARSAMPMRRWPVSPKPNPLPPLTSTTAAFFSAGTIVASVSTPGLTPSCHTAPVLGSTLPAEAVGRRGSAGRAHHQRLAFGAQHVVLAVHHHLQVARQVVGARDDPALRSRCPVGRSVGHRPLGAEPRPVPGRHGLVDLAVGDEAVRPCPTGSRMCCCNVGLELLPAHDLDHATKNLVVRIRVLPLLRRVRRLASTAASWSTPRASSSSSPVASGCAALPCHVEKPLVWLSSCRIVMTPGGPAREPVEIVRDLGVQVDLARLDQLHDGQRREALGDRADHERRVRRDLHVASEPDDAPRTRRGDARRRPRRRRPGRARRKQASRCR